MANGVFNIAKGKANAFVERVATNDPANSALVAVYLESAQADADLQDYDNLSLLLANAGNTEAAFTNYARIVKTDADISAPTPDDTANLMASFIGNLTIANAGGAVNETLAKIIICYDPDTTGGDDTTLIPLTHHDFTETTDGTDLIAQEAAGGFFSAS